MKNTLHVNGKLIALNKPIIMGILNVTPDSFYKDSRLNPNSEDFLKKAEQMILEGVDILDLGAYSTRPGGIDISVNEEVERLIPALKKIKKYFPEVPVSVDTFRAAVAEKALDEGADIINDISGGDFDKKMFPLIISKKCPYILMHLQGSIETMHNETSYNSFFTDLADKLFKKANYLREAGVKDIIIDPGFGFSKTIEQNYFLLQNLTCLQNDYFPLLVGISRKSMIYKPLEIRPEDSLEFSILLNTVALQKGATILRVHEIKPYIQLQRIHELLES